MRAESGHVNDAMEGLPGTERKTTQNRPRALPPLDVDKSKYTSLTKLKDIARADESGWTPEFDKSGFMRQKSWSSDIDLLGKLPVKKEDSTVLTANNSVVYTFNKVPSFQTFQSKRDSTRASATIDAIRPSNATTKVFSIKEEEEIASRKNTSKSTQPPKTLIPNLTRYFGCGKFSDASYAVPTVRPEHIKIQTKPLGEQETEKSPEIARSERQSVLERASITSNTTLSPEQVMPQVAGAFGYPVEKGARMSETASDPEKIVFDFKVG
ncbi:hypothetical protein EDD86DRAFT_244154 [Gorgonomyces haynaldii]|nr:hypothetical protein EDD86DRAFT_244154 [Gorgonomyces haynaldii]